jgi:predicted Zn-dependent protease
MKSSPLLLSAALALLLPALPATHVFAQESHGGVDESTPNTRAARRAAKQKQAGPAAEVPAYPKATRESPKQSGDKSLASQMEAMIALQSEDGAEDKVIAKADAILANPKATPYDKSAAAYLAGAAWQNKDTPGFSEAIKYYKLAIDNDGLSNNNHFRAMQQVAQLLESEDRHAEALAMIDRFITETQSDDANAWTIKTQILLNMERPKEAATAVEKLLAAKPGDKKLMMTLAAVYMQSGEDAKAGQMFDKMRAAGLLTESKDYETGFRLLANIEGRQKDALAFIDEGLKKGILKPSFEMYALQGQAAWEAEDTKGAMAAWTKGAPMSKNGEMYLNLAQLQADAGQFAEAKASAIAAREKGVKRVGATWQVLARAEDGLGNKAASTAALKEAAKYPESKKWAEAALRQGIAR